MKKNLTSIFTPIIISILLSLIFYYPFFKKNLVPAPLDIIPGMYLPWMDQRLSVFPNGGPVKNPLPSDVVSLTLPLRYQAVNIIKNKQWPLWNPSILLGTPLLANFQSAVFNPLNLIYFTNLKFIDAWSIQVISQSLLAFIFFYIFIGEFEKNIFAKTLGSLVWAYNGFFSLWFQYNTVVFAAIYLPLILYAIKKLSKNFLWGLLISAGLCLSVFSGNPPVSLIVYGAALLFGIIIYLKSPKNLLLVFAFIALSVCYSAPQLFVGISSSNDSIRQYDNIATTANIKYLNPIKLITILIPDYFGNPSTRNTWENYPLYDNSTIYNGILPIILLLISTITIYIKEQKKLKIYSYLLLIISLVFMIPSPISKFIGSLNVLGLSSMVFTRFSLTWSLALSIITSLTISKLINKELKYSKLLYTFFILFICIGVPFTISLVLNKYFGQIPLIDYIWLNQTKTAYRNSIYPLIILISYGFILTGIYYIKKQFIKNILVFLLVVLTIFDLYKFFNKYNSFTNISDYYPKSEITDYLSNNSFRFARESSQLIPSNMWTMYDNLKTASGYDTTYSHNYGQFISMVNSGNISNSSNRYLEIDQFNSPLLDLMSIDHIIATKTNRFGLSTNGSITPSLSSKKFKLVKDYGRYQLLKNTTSLPFIRTINQVLYTDSAIQTEIYFRQQNINNVGIVEDKSLNNVILDKSIKIENQKIDTQKIVFSTTNSDNKNPSFIIISQNFDRGWKLKVDNISGDILKVNHSFIGFMLPQGNHQVELRYEPDIFFFSLRLSIISVTISIIFIILSIIWKKIKN